MTAHISDELPRMLTGEASRDAVLAAADHLRSCVDCQQELVSAVVAHASLTSAHRFAPEIVSHMFAGTLGETETAETAETPRTREDAESEPGSDDNDPDALSDFALPDLSSVFAQVRREAAEPRRSARPMHPAARTRYLVGAAAAAVLLGSGAAVYLATSGNNTTTSPPTAARTVRLSPFDTGTSAATAKIRGAGMSIDAASLPHLSGKRYEVWLTNDARTKMQPVGWLGADGVAAMTIPSDLMAQYQDIEVSVQPVDTNDYVYSGTSVLRGSIA
jgi:hypothetical protein